MSGVFVRASATMLASGEDAGILLSLAIRALSRLVGGVLVRLERAAGRRRRWRWRLSGRERSRREEHSNHQGRRCYADYQPALQFRHSEPPFDDVLWAW